MERLKRTKRGFVGVKRFRKRFRKKTRFSKTLFSSMLVGRTTTAHIYQLSLYYGYDSNYKGGYAISMQRAGVSTVFLPAGSSNPLNWNLGSASTFTFPAARNGIDASTPISLGFLLGSNVSIPNSFNSFTDKYRYCKIAGVTVKPSLISVPYGQTLFNTMGAQIASTFAAMAVLPNLYFNCADHIGIAATGTFGNIDTSISSDVLWGYPQRCKGSLRFKPHSTDDSKKDIQRFFKFGSFCIPPHFAFSNNTNITVCGLGHWFPTVLFNNNDPVNTDTPFINGAILYGMEPPSALTGTSANTNYQNIFNLIGEVKVTIHCDWRGQYDYTTMGIQ